MFRCVALARHHRVRAVHGDEGGLPLDGVRDACRGAEPHLHRAAALRRHRARRLDGGASASSASRSPARTRSTSSSYAMYHVTQYPYQMGVQLYSDALGFAILQQGNRFLGWTPDFVRWLLLLIVLGGMLAAARAAAAARPRRGSPASSSPPPRSPSSAGTSPARSPPRPGRTRSRAQSAATLRHPFGWVDDATHLKPTLYMGEAEVDQNPEWLLEFWNRSIDARQQPRRLGARPGPSGSPNVKLERHPLLAGRSERAHAAVRLRGRGPAVHRLRRSDRQDAPVSRGRPLRRRGSSSGSRIRTGCRARATASTPTAGRERTTARTSASAAPPDGCASSTRAATGATRAGRRRCASCSTGSSRATRSPRSVRR